jgi:hypothetical protein
VSVELARYRFRPRHRGVAAVAGGVGAALIAVGLIFAGATASFPLIAGIAGVALAGAYFASPTWRYAVTADADGLAVVSGSRTKFRLRWADVVHVVASPTTKTCFVDGGEPGVSLLVPGDGAPAPYAIEDRAVLYDRIVASVDPAKISTVETLEAEVRSAAAPRG